MPAFDLVALGCGGGPSEHNLSSYIFKLSDVAWKDGAVALEAGSGLGALSSLLRLQPNLFDSRPRQSGCPDSGSPNYSAAEVYSWIRCFLITHSHLDHVNGLILSAGSLGGPRRQVYGAQHTLEDLSTIFSGRIWPKLASWDEGDPLPLLLSALSANGHYRSIAPDISVRMMPISHGQPEGLGTYECAAFFVRHDRNLREFLFFGDVEPDTISANPRNKYVWREAAPKIPDTLSAIFIECSYPSGRRDDLLYGHLSPEHLLAELTCLAVEVINGRTQAYRGQALPAGSSSPARKKQRRDTAPPPPSPRGALEGLRVYIIHCKDDIHGIYDRPIHHVVADEVRTLVDARGLGATIIAVDQGMQIAI
ncbi:hypothetical protein OBBRIDRAFT_616699 [Obba rivulosa]|uniref:Cyclic-AMP phosphodiesterase n=1 Tax=Obba rivulosa TaxID=1052685 RepID=A0A8E2DT12_9APHY|nr:hypothetical protein OBBRIDRAFT_616699 [Obba rivulosa]